MSRDEALAVAPDVETYINSGDTDLARIGNRSLFPEVTSEVEAAIREAESECYVSSRGGSGRRIHLPADETSEPLCEQGDSLLGKPLAAYPPGYLDLCVTCATMWRYREHGVRDEPEVPELASADEEPEVATDGGLTEPSTDETERRKGYAWICTGCKKIISSQPFGPCHDCGGHYRPATADDAACDRCDDPDGRRLLDRTGEHDRLCSDCIDEVIR